MADGTSVPANVIVGASPAARRVGSLKRLSRHRSTIAFLMCLPLILLIAGRDLSGVLRDLSSAC